MFTSDKQLGVVMSGGMSERMGKDKGMLLLNDRTWAENAYHKLTSLGIPVVVSIRNEQISEYSKVFNPNQLLADTVNLKGPLCGLLSIHEKFPNHDLFILACDMIEIRESSLSKLFQDVAIAGSEFDFTVYTDKQNNPEPLLGYYSAEGLSKIYKFYLGNLLEKHSIKYILDISNTQYIPFPFEINELNNYNTHNKIEH